MLFFSLPSLFASPFDFSRFFSHFQFAVKYNVVAGIRLQPSAFIEFIVCHSPSIAKDYIIFLPV